MKVGLIGCISILIVLGGCGGQGGKTSTSPLDPNAVWDGTPPEQEAMPDFFEGRPAGGEFPESMVGVWETALPGIEWGIKLEPSGSIMRIVHSLAGKVDIAQGGVEANGPDDSYYVFSMGPCEARYTPETKVLRVKIIVDYFIFKLPAGEIEGRQEDYFEGPVPEEGSTWWETRWFSFKWVKGAAPPDVNLIKANPVPLIFMKHDFTKSGQDDE